MTDPSILGYGRITIIGGGLIGTSLAHAVRRADPDISLVIADQKEVHRETLAGLGLNAVITARAADAVAGSDLVVLAVPVGAMPHVLADIADHLQPGATVSDVGSTKANVLAAMQAALPETVHAVPGHPVAGTEQSGPGAGFSSLFDDRWCILTPPADADADSVTRLSAFWTTLGARVEHMDAAHHDRVLAITSHVPHLIAYNIVGTASDLEEVTQSEVIKYSAGGFRDFTRIAASNPTMWRDVFLANKDAVLEMLGRFNEDLIALQRAIRWDDGDALHALFTRTRDIRRGIIDAGQDDAAPDFGRQHTD